MPLLIAGSHFFLRLTRRRYFDIYSASRQIIFAEPRFQFYFRFHHHFHSFAFQRHFS
jgi:hypothetical protein